MAAGAVCRHPIAALPGGSTKFLTAQKSQNEMNRNRINLWPLLRKIRDLLKRLRGFSTPLGGLAWAAKDSGGSEAVVQSDNPILTPAECALILKVDDKEIIKLLESGKVSGFTVGGEWRVTVPGLVQFIAEQSSETQLKILARNITDPKMWAGQLRKDPEFAKQIQEGNYPENSMGRFLQYALKNYKG